MRYIIDGIKELSHPEGPRSGRLEGRMLSIQSRERELQEHAWS
jgi:hypothetical protein